MNAQLRERQTRSAAFPHLLQALGTSLGAPSTEQPLDLEQLAALIDDDGEEEEPDDLALPPAGQDDARRSAKQPGSNRRQHLFHVKQGVASEKKQEDPGTKLNAADLHRLGNMRQFMFVPTHLAQDDKSKQPSKERSWEQELEALEDEEYDVHVGSTSALRMACAKRAVEYIEKARDAKAVPNERVLEVLSEAKARALCLDSPNLLADLSLSLEYAGPQLTELYIHDVVLSPTQLQAFADTNQARALTVLSLQNAGIDGALSLSSVLDFVLRTPKLEALLLDDNRIGDDGVAALSDALVGQRKESAGAGGAWAIETLGLARNSIGATGVSSLVRALLTPVSATNPTNSASPSTQPPSSSSSSSSSSSATATSLFLLLDEIEPVTSEEKSLGYWRRFPQLSLSGNELALASSSASSSSQSPVELLVELCSRNPTVTSLELQNTGVDDQGAVALAKMLSAGASALKELVLDDNRALTEVGVGALVRALREREGARKGRARERDEARAQAQARAREMQNHLDADAGLNVAVDGGAEQAKDGGEAGKANAAAAAGGSAAEDEDGGAGCLDCLSLRGIDIRWLDNNDGQGYEQQEGVLAVVGELLGDNSQEYYIDEQEIVLLPGSGAANTTTRAAPPEVGAGKAARASSLALPGLKLQVTDPAKAKAEVAMDDADDDDAVDMSHLDVSGFAAAERMEREQDEAANIRAAFGKPIAPRTTVEVSHLDVSGFAAAEKMEREQNEAANIRAAFGKPIAPRATADLEFLDVSGFEAADKMDRARGDGEGDSGDGDSGDGDGASDIRAAFGVGKSPALGRYPTVDGSIPVSSPPKGAPSLASGVPPPRGAPPPRGPPPQRTLSQGGPPPGAGGGPPNAQRHLSTGGPPPRGPPGSAPPPRGPPNAQRHMSNGGPPPRGPPPQRTLSQGGPPPGGPPNAQRHLSTGGPPPRPDKGRTFSSGGPPGSPPPRGAPPPRGPPPQQRTLSQGGPPPGGPPNAQRHLSTGGPPPARRRSSYDTKEGRRSLI